MSPALVKRLTAVKVIPLHRAFSPCCFQKLAQFIAHDFFHHPSRGLTNLCSQILMKVLLTQGLVLRSLNPLHKLIPHESYKLALEGALFCYRI
jgi:hypothetical protein